MHTLSRELDKSNDSINVTPHPYLVSDSLLGVEVELEGRFSNISNRQEIERHFDVVSEQSIDGYELVFNRPKGGVDVIEALSSLDSSFNARQAAKACSNRCSVHVHVDMLDMDRIQMMNFITLCVMFEKVLYNYVEPHRSKNHFCLPLTDAEVTLNKVCKLSAYIKRDNGNGNLSSILSSCFSVSSDKYCGINLTSIKRYGTLEFRMHHATTKMIDIVRWINILLTIKEYAMQGDRTPVNILDTKIDLGIDTIFREVLCGYSSILDYNGVELDILEGIRNAQDIVAPFRTIDTIGNTIPNDVPYKDLIERFVELLEDDEDDYDEDDYDEDD